MKVIAVIVMVLVVAADWGMLLWTFSGERSGAKAAIGAVMLANTWCVMERLMGLVG